MAQHLQFSSLTSTEPPTAREWTACRLLLGCYVVGALIALIWADLPGPALPTLLAVYQTGIVFADVPTAFLLLNEAQDRQQTWLACLATAYTWSALFAVLHLLTFPGALVPDHTLLGGTQLGSYIFIAWRLGYAGFVLSACLVFLAGTTGRAGLKRWLPATALAVGAALFVMLLGAEARLPRLVEEGRFTNLDLFLSWIAVPLGLAACVLCWWRARTDALQLWMAVALTTWCGDLVISNVAGARFTVGWYLARTSGLISACTLFLFFLFRSVVQQRAALRAARDLRERTISLQMEISRRARAEEQLMQLQKLDAMGQLTGGLAHDFNNLLAAIVGNLDLLGRNAKELGTRAQRWVENALLAAERGRKLTNQLLVFARVQRLEIKPVRLADALSRAHDLVLRTLGADIQICMDPVSDPTHVMADETQFELAILNVALNARDAMARGGQLRITVSAYSAGEEGDMAPGRYACISVSDSGEGMTPDVMARAFDPFFTTKGAGKGTGLGLSQVYGFARKAGGTAKIESELGRGTRVHLFLPAAAGTTKERKPDELPEPRNVVTDARVLVVDDDPHVRAFLVDCLEQIGLATLDASGGAEALARLKGSRPDLMIADFAMPEMNGSELVKRVRTLHPDLPVIFVTGYADTEAIDEIEGRPPLLLKKPFRSHELQAVIAEALQRGRSQ